MRALPWNHPARDPCGAITGLTLTLALPHTGVVLDAANDPVLRSGRVGAIDSVPPGESQFRLEITVASSQLQPLTLKKFKAQGFLGVVNRSGAKRTADRAIRVGTGRHKIVLERCSRRCVGFVGWRVGS